ncbi:LOW QUALITY PROTEIN: OTU deubiquitinase with linear linkage specificity a [Plectropomus leopardus]|uniref:LOW QUALITY PROTEIN: OTU deubiquitinase with linear linkage specificity a n=2 Tax=Plectropomus leopardus TaxID=160734 RepID=UPI001C4BF4EC|nr:LOW QUALITY PROTEIN: OTU deubiquitinase with linear linkage specificity a [Plectropomus leopardus]
MSWVKAVSNSVDVFDEDGDELSLQSREWTSNMRKRLRDGFVDGADAGEEVSLQVGFNLGFREGAAQTAAVGRLKGIVSAILCWCQIQRPGVPLPASVTDLLQRVSQHEDAIREGIRKALESPPPSVSSVSESMEDLQVQPADSGCCGGEGCKDTDCCRNGDKMDLDVPHQQQKFSSGSTDGSSGSSESLNELVQRCVDLVSELGLPQELVSHIQELKDM